MIPKHYNNEIIPKIYFKVAEVSEMLHESPSCIRYWSDKILCSNFRNRGGDRLFTKVDVAKMHIIKNLIRVEKYTVIGAKLKLPTIPL